MERIDYKEIVSLSNDQLLQRIFDRVESGAVDVQLRILKQELIHRLLAINFINKPIQ